VHSEICQHARLYFSIHAMASESSVLTSPAQIARHQAGGGTASLKSGNPEVIVGSLVVLWFSCSTVTSEDAEQDRRSPGAVRGVQNAGSLTLGFLRGDVQDLA
jgi:hypothetical protein